MRRVLSFVLALVFAFAAHAEPLVTASGRLRFVPGPGAQGLAEGLATVADADRDMVARDLGKDWDGITEVRVALDDPSFRALLPEHAGVPHWAQGVAFPDLNLVVLRAFPGDPEARATLRHELSHIAVGRLTHDGVPRWFLEGLATIRAGDAWSRQGPSLVRAAVAGRLFRFDDLANGFPAGATDAELAYAQSADFVSWLVERSGEAAVQAVLRDVVAGATFDGAIEARLGGRLHALEHDWGLSLARWELLARVLTQTEIWWVLLAVMFLFAGWRIRRHKKKLLAQMEADENAERARLLASVPGVWADAPPSRPAPIPHLHDRAPPEEDDDAPVEDSEPTDEEHLAEVEAPPSEEPAAAADEAPEDDDERADDDLPYFVRPATAPKKPTLH